MTELDNQLIDAVENNQTDKAKVLLSKGANVDADDGRPLWAASNFGNLAMAELLIENGAEVTDCDGHPLLRVIYNDNLEMTELLIEKGANVNCHDGMPLWWAAYYGRPEIAKLLISNGAEVSDHILYRAEKNGDTEIVDYLKCIISKAKQND